MSGAAAADEEGAGARTRRQILEAADRHFRHYGYGKTTVADLAREVGVSPAYVYKFFDSKRAIGEAVCAATLERILAALEAVVVGPEKAPARLRRFFETLLEQGLTLYFDDRRLHDIVRVAIAEHWVGVVEAYRAALARLIERLVAAGRDEGSFERKTPLGDVAKAIACTAAAFCHPVILEQTPHEALRAEAALVADLVLRSLAP